MATFEKRKTDEKARREFVVFWKTRFKSDPKRVSANESGEIDCAFVRHFEEFAFLRPHHIEEMVLLRRRKKRFSAKDFGEKTLHGLPQEFPIAVFEGILEKEKETKHDVKEPNGCKGKQKGPSVSQGRDEEEKSATDPSHEKKSRDNGKEAFFPFFQIEKVNAGKAEEKAE
jgi:hypothetical protein